MTALEVAEGQGDEQFHRQREHKADGKAQRLAGVVVVLLGGDRLHFARRRVNAGKVHPVDGGIGVAVQRFGHGVAAALGEPEQNLEVLWGHVAPGGGRVVLHLGLPLQKVVAVRVFKGGEGLPGGVLLGGEPIRRLAAGQVPGADGGLLRQQGDPALLREARGLHLHGGLWPHIREGGKGHRQRQHKTNQQGKQSLFQHGSRLLFCPHHSTAEREKQPLAAFCNGFVTRKTGAPRKGAPAKAAIYFSSQMGSFSIQRPNSSL